MKRRDFIATTAVAAVGVAIDPVAALVPSPPALAFHPEAFAFVTRELPLPMPYIVWHVQREDGHIEDVIGKWEVVEKPAK